jgi:hypothetical protein
MRIGPSFPRQRHNVTCAPKTDSYHDQRFDTACRIRFLEGRYLYPFLIDRKSAQAEPKRIRKPNDAMNRQTLCEYHITRLNNGCYSEKEAMGRPIGNQDRPLPALTPSSSNQICAASRCWSSPAIGRQGRMNALLPISDNSFITLGGKYSWDFV